MDKAVLVSDAAHLSAGIPGGVQVCTAEYVRLLETAGFELTYCTLQATRQLVARVKVRLGVEIYERYDFSADFANLRECIANSNAKHVFLNQVALIGFAPLIKREYGGAVKVVVLSHGNESGDFLHEIAGRRHSASIVGRMRDVFRLGNLLLHEHIIYSEFVDLMLVMSGIEREINKWLGARRSVVIPRTFSAEDVGWSPQLGRIGFVGTLDHAPNLEGLRAVLSGLINWGSPERRVRLIGSPQSRGVELACDFHFVDYLGSLTNEMLRREIASWALFLNPIFWYSRGASTKLALGINAGVPIVSTPAGNRGYEWNEGRILSVETPAEMATVIRDVSEDRERLNDLAKDVRLVSVTGPELGRLAQLLRRELR